MTATFPIPHCTVLLGNGDRFETEHVDHLYNLHAEIHEAYPLLPLGGFRLDLVEENEEEERAVFRLVMSPHHLQTDVLIDQVDDDLWIIELSFSWWLREQEEDGAYDSWSVFTAISPYEKRKRFYGQVDEDHTTLITWHSTLTGLLSAYPYGIYTHDVITSIEEKIDQLVDDLKL